MSFDPESILKLDGYLEPFIPAITSRYTLFQQLKQKIQNFEGGLDNFSKGYNKFGFNVLENNEVTYREWAPNASEAVLIGDFSQCHQTVEFLLLIMFNQDDWNRISHPMTRDKYGVWEIVVPPNSNGEPTIPHDSKVKVLFNSLGLSLVELLQLTDLYDITNRRADRKTSHLDKKGHSRPQRITHLRR
jgi:1,4-alpha-glucan branching enzyme